MAEIGFLPATLLTARVLAAFDLESVDGLLLAYQRGRLSRPLKDICPILFATASQGDEVARNVISTFARDVSRYMLAGIRKYQLQETEIEIVLSGGVFKARSSLLLNTIASEIHQVAPKARMIEALYEPVVGAALLVLDEILGRPLPEAVMANCLTSAEKMELKRF